MVRGVPVIKPAALCESACVGSDMTHASVLILLCAAFIIPASVAHAQSAPPSVPPRIVDPGLIEQQNRRNQIEIEQRSAPELSGPPVVAPKANPAVVAAPGGPTFLLKQVVFDASTFLTRHELEALAAPLIGRRIDIATVQRLVKSINDIYAARQIATAAAYLPPQDLKAGTLRIGIVEGRLGRVVVKGNAALSVDFLKDRISVEPGQVVDTGALADDVARFNKTGVAQIQAFLQPGAQFGLTDIGLGVVEPPTNALQLFVDNQGVSSVGRLEGGMLFQRYAPLGLDDKLTVYAVKSEGDISGNVGYNLPFDTLGGRVGASFTRGHIHIVNGPFVPLDIDGDSTSSALNLSHPVFVDQEWLLLGLASLSYGKSTSQQSKVSITNNDTLKGTAGFTLGYAGQAFTASATPTFSRAHTEFQVTNARTDFTLYGGTYSASYRLPAEFLATLGGAFQVANRALIPGDSLFQVGGPTTVRGYPTDALAGPTGYYGNLELHHGLDGVGETIGAPPWFRTIDAFAFYDRGAVYNPSPKAVTLNSMGVGLSDALTKSVLAEISAGFPINDAVPRQPGYALYFRLTAKFE